MKININNNEKITAAIKKAEGTRASVRLMKHSDITLSLPEIENRLFDLLGHKKKWIGARVTIQENFGKKPGAYRGTIEATFAVIERYPSGWFMINCGRDACDTGGKGDWTIYLNDELLEIAANNLKNRLTEYY